jgi:hypothetical protein
MLNEKSKKTKFVEGKTVRTFRTRSSVERVLFNLVMIPLFCQTPASVTTVANKESASGIPTLWHFN